MTRFKGLDSTSRLHHGCLDPVIPPMSTITFVWAERLGWIINGRKLPLSSYSVKRGTDMLLQASGLPGARAEMFSKFCSLALLNPTPEAIEAAVKRLPSVLSRLWRLRWENKHKEVFWRLIYDGLPTHVRMRFSNKHCVCGLLHPPDRAHHYWDCPLALAVIDTIVSQLPVGT